MKDIDKYLNNIEYHYKKGFLTNIRDKRIFDEKMYLDLISSMEKVFRNYVEKDSLPKLLYIYLASIDIAFGTFAYFNRHKIDRGDNEERIQKYYKEFRKLYFKILGLDENEVQNFPILD